MKFMYKKLFQRKNNSRNDGKLKVSFSLNYTTYHVETLKYYEISQYVGQKCKSCFDI